MSVSVSLATGLHRFHWWLLLHSPPSEVSSPEPQGTRVLSGMDSAGLKHVLLRTSISWCYHLVKMFSVCYHLSMSTKRKATMLRLTEQDIALIEQLKLHYGVTSSNEMVRMSLRAAQREMASPITPREEEHSPPPL